MRPDYILTLSCPDRPGIVHRVTGLLFESGCNIADTRQFGDVESQRISGSRPDHRTGRGRRGPAMTPREPVRVGSGTESQVLARAVRRHGSTGFC